MKSFPVFLKRIWLEHAIPSSWGDSVLGVYVWFPLINNYLYDIQCRVYNQIFNKKRKRMNRNFLAVLCVGFVMLFVGTLAIAESTIQIGRASCRERVSSPV